VKIDSGIHAVLVKVAAMGLNPHKHLGQDLATLQPHFTLLARLYGSNICGEGGEYESLTLDSPLFKVRDHVISPIYKLSVYSRNFVSNSGDGVTVRVLLARGRMGFRVYPFPSASCSRAVFKLQWRFFLSTITERTHCNVWWIHVLCLDKHQEGGDTVNRLNKAGGKSVPKREFLLHPHS
jgi:hypothetical protein